MTTLREPCPTPSTSKTVKPASFRQVGALGLSMRGERRLKQRPIPANAPFDKSVFEEFLTKLQTHRTKVFGDPSAAYDGSGDTGCRRIRNKARWTYFWISRIRLRGKVRPASAQRKNEIANSHSRVERRRRTSESADSESSRRTVAEERSAVCDVDGTVLRNRGALRWRRTPYLAWAAIACSASVPVLAVTAVSPSFATTAPSWMTSSLPAACSTSMRTPTKWKIPRTALTPRTAVISARTNSSTCWTRWRSRKNSPPWLRYRLRRHPGFSWPSRRHRAPRRRSVAGGRAAQIRNSRTFPGARIPAAWDRPRSACLASRLPYGTEVTWSTRSSRSRQAFCASWASANFASACTTSTPASKLRQENATRLRSRNGPHYC